MSNYRILAGVLLSVQLMAQSPARDSSRVYQALKFSPMHLINIYPCFLLGYERQVATNKSIQLDVGPVFQYESFSTRFIDKRGIKAKAELKLFLHKKNFKGWDHFIAIETYWNRVNFDRITTQTECFDLSCQNMFSRTYSYTIKHSEVGLALKYGFAFFSRKSFVQDFTLGVTLRIIDYKKPSLPPPVFPVQEWFFIQIPNETPRTVMGITMGYRLGYRL